MVDHGLQIPTMTRVSVVYAQAYPSTIIEQLLHARGAPRERDEQYRQYTKNKTNEE
jgi:hypothetical protein